MSNYVTTSEQYIAATAQYYGSIETNLERIALERGFRTRTGRINIEKLSEASGVSTSTLHYLIKDKEHFRCMNLVTLAKLCAALGVQPGDLLTFVPGGSAAGLGYSTSAFDNLIGTQNRGGIYDPYSEDAGDERGGEAEPFREEN